MFTSAGNPKRLLADHIVHDLIRSRMDHQKCTPSHLNNLVQEPGHRLQLELGDVVGDGLQEGAEVGVGKLHAGEQIRDDPLKQWDVL